MAKSVLVNTIMPSKGGNMKIKKLYKLQDDCIYIPLTIFILLIFLIQNLFPQENPSILKIGDKAPLLTLEVLLQAPVNIEASLENLKGKIIVLEFWTTWCGPCRKALPHLNKLFKKYSNKPVQFIAVTNEDKWRVKNYIKYTPISGWIGLDLDSSVFTAYGIRSLPQTILIGKQGKIAVITHPLSLDSKMLDKLLAGQTLQPSQKEIVPKASKKVKIKQEDKVKQPLLELVIRPSKPSISMSLSSRKFKARGMTLEKIVSIAYGISPVRVISSSPLASNTYEILIELSKDDRNTLLSLLQQSLKAAFGLKVRRETREMDVLVLVSPRDKKSLLCPVEKEMSIMSDEGQVTSQGTNLAYFCRALEGSLEKIVINETNLKGLYDIALYWDPNNLNTIFSSIREQLGLELKIEKKSIEVMVFETESSPIKNNHGNVSK